MGSDQVALGDLVRRAEWPRGLTVDLIEYPGHVALRFCRDEWQTLTLAAQHQAARAFAQVAHQAPVKVYAEQSGARSATVGSAQKGKGSHAHNENTRNGEGVSRGRIMFVSPSCQVQSLNDEVNAQPDGKK